jgi:hypothetical protein
MGWLTSSGSFSNTQAFLDRIIKGDFFSRIDGHARRGVDALRSQTPRESGLTADSWEYEVEATASGVTIWWTNKNVVNGFNVAVGLQYGHGTGNGGWVEGYDYINPALRPVFDKIAEAVWKEVLNS